MRATDEAQRRWEHGSDFHAYFTEDDLAPSPNAIWRTRDPRWLGSGRDAMRFAIRHGRQEMGWARLFVPDYFCEEVVSAIETELPIERYRADPWCPSTGVPGLTATDVVLSVPYFGMTAPVPRRGEHGVIEDHTHDPFSRWSVSSNADICVASLRKTLPVPEGGAAWSPRFVLPPAPDPSAVRVRAASAKRDAMRLKAAYLTGADIEKESFRALALSGESEIASGPISGITDETLAAVTRLPVERWADTRRANHALLGDLLSRVPWLDALRPHDDATPFAFVFRVDSYERREQLRLSLIGANVYPAVLWPIESGSCTPRVRRLSQQTLVVHCDARYSHEDMVRVAHLIQQLGTLE